MALRFLSYRTALTLLLVERSLSRGASPAADGHTVLAFWVDRFEIPELALRSRGFGRLTITQICDLHPGHFQVVRFIDSIRPVHCQYISSAKAISRDLQACCPWHYLYASAMTIKINVWTGSLPLASLIFGTVPINIVRRYGHVSCPISVIILHIRRQANMPLF
jgi:hypothetical protein